MPVHPHVRLVVPSASLHSPGLDTCSRASLFTHPPCSAHPPCPLTMQSGWRLCAWGWGWPCLVGEGTGPGTQRVPKRCSITVVQPTAQARPTGVSEATWAWGRAPCPDRYQGADEGAAPGPRPPGGQQGERVCPPWRGAGGCWRGDEAPGCPASLRAEGKQEASACRRPSGLCCPCPICRCIPGSVPHLAGRLQLSLPGPERGNLGE